MTYHFAPYRLDLARRRLTRNGTEIALEPKVYALLRLLIQHRARIVTRDEIHDALWPDIQVGDGSIDRIVKELRRALQDDGRRQGRIRTHRGVGYRLVANVEAPNDIEAADRACETLSDAIDQLSGGSRFAIRRLLTMLRTAENRCRNELSRLDAPRDDPPSSAASNPAT